LTIPGSGRPIGRSTLLSGHQRISALQVSSHSFAVVGQMEVRLLDQRPATGSDCGGHLLQHLRGMVSDLMQQGSIGDEIVSVDRQLGRLDVRLHDGEVLRSYQIH
jgi:hypothetical protein